MGVKGAHMVSKSYMRGWADSTNSVEIIDKQDNRSFITSINNATVVNYVYDPKVLMRDLEHEYSVVEGAGIPAINKLRNGDTILTVEDQHALIEFMDMHLDRGRYANQAKTLAPALLLKTNGTHEDSELNLGDLICLSQYLNEVIRLKNLGIEEWTWKVVPTERLATGDGAVLLWKDCDSENVSTITFPISPTRLLVIGHDLPDGIDINLRIAANSKRWIIGQRGTLNMDFAKQTIVRE